LKPGVLSLPPLNAEIAQLVERDLAKVEVASSNLVFRSTKSLVFSDRAFFILFAQPGLKNKISHPWMRVAHIDRSVGDLLN
jgi:hypothetical protein